MYCNGDQFKSGLSSGPHSQFVLQLPWLARAYGIVLIAQHGHFHTQLWCGRGLTLVLMMYVSLSVKDII